MELRFPLHIMIFDCVKRLWTHGSTGGCHLFSSFLSSNTAHTSAPLHVFYLVQCTRLAGAWKCVTGSRTRKKNPYFQVAKRFDCDEWPVCVFSVPIHINKSERPDRTSTPRQHATSHKMSCPSVYVHQTCQNLLFFFFFLFLASWRSVCDFSHETVFLFSFWQFVCRRVFFFFF